MDVTEERIEGIEAAIEEILSKVQDQENHVIIVKF